jgi:hypothetical protein
MKNNPFQVTTPPIASMRGRAREMQQLRSHLQKEVPDHVSVVGPRFIGKTVLLNALGSYFAGGDRDFDACLYWDIRHGMPTSDDGFLSEFGGRLKGPIERINADAVKMLTSEGSRFEVIKIVFETLQDENRQLLVIMDGLDGVLLSTDITKNLWDNLRSLAELSSIRFVTGSRRRLRELCASPDSKTSDFWNIFYDTPLAVGAFSPNDIGEFVQLFKKAGITFERGAETELANWCGGVPIATSFLCNRLWDKLSDGQTVSPDFVNESCERALEDGQDYWQGLWDDCSHEDRAFLFEVAKAGEVGEDDVNRKRAASLAQRGFLTVADHRIRFSSRTLRRFTEQAGPSSTELRRLFGTPEEFRRNAKPLAEIRLQQMPVGDQSLRDSVSVAVANLDKAHIVLNQVRGFVNRALLMVWNSEIPDRKIPADWTFKWQDGSTDPPAGTISSDDVGRQLRLLNFMTGNRRAAPTRIRRSTYLMLNSLKGIGDFGVHLGNEILGVGFGIVVALLLIEVFEHLTSDLASTLS